MTTVLIIYKQASFHKKIFVPNLQKHTCPFLTYVRSPWILRLNFHWFSPKLLPISTCHFYHNLGPLLLPTCPPPLTPGPPSLSTGPRPLDWPEMCANTRQTMGVGGRVEERLLQVLDEEPKASLSLWHIITNGSCRLSDCPNSWDVTPLGPLLFLVAPTDLPSPCLSASLPCPATPTAAGKLQAVEEGHNLAPLPKQTIRKH